MKIKVRNFIKQAIKFIGLSGIGWLLDFFIYTILGHFSRNLFFNNCISSWMGVTFVFIFSTRKVFQNNSRISLKVKYLIYILYQCVLIFLISRLLNWINTFMLVHFIWVCIDRFSYLISKILVTPITMTLNFFVMKGVIEKI